LGFRVDPQGVNEWERRTQRIKETARETASMVRGMLAGVVGLAALRSLANTADTMQSLEARVGMLNQTVTDGATAFDVVQQRAFAARQGINEYANLYIKLSNAGKDYIKTQEEGLTITDTISKALVVGGATRQEQSSAMLQFAQAIGSGRLQGDELRAISESAPMFLDKLAEHMGIARAELKKMGSQGKLTSEAVVKATLEMSKEFDDMFRNMPMTIGQAITLVGNRWAEFVNRMNRESSAVTLIADTFLSVFDMISDGLGKMVDFFGGAVNTIKFFGTALAAALAPFIIRSFIGSIALLLSPAGLLFLALMALGFALEDFYTWVKGGPSILGRLFGSFDQFRPRLEAAWQSVKAATAAFMDWLGQAWTTIRGAFDASMNGGLLSDVMRFAAWLLGVLQFVADFLATWIDWQAVVSGWQQMLGGLLGIVVGFIDTVFGLFKMLWGALTLDSDLFGEGLRQAFGGLESFVHGVADSILGAFRIAFDGIRGLFAGVVDGIKSKWAAAKAFLGIGADGSTAGVAGAGGVNPARVSVGTIRDATASPAGVPQPGAGGVNVTVNQTLPPGTTAETAKAAHDATRKAVGDSTLGKAARQMGQVQ
ncbi:MAG: tape measure protein, partial [Burkholderiaceae bacterium]